MKRVFGMFEAVFDLLYLLAGAVVAVLLFMGDASPQRMLAGLMAVVLVAGDSFHLVPRVASIFTGKEECLRSALGRGKQITSITMTVFYVLLWHIGLLAAPMQNEIFFLVLFYLLAAVRIFLCFLPQNRWQQRYPPVSWGIFRNIPFALMGLMVAMRFFSIGNVLPGFSFGWLAVLLSFGFYLPVVLWSNRQPKVGMLMLPKTCCYLWLLVMCLSL